MNRDVDFLLAPLRAMHASAEGIADQMLAWYARRALDPQLSTEERAGLKVREREFDARQRVLREKMRDALHEAETVIARALRSERRSRRRSTR